MLFTIAVACICWVASYSIADTLAISAAALFFFAVMAAVATDLTSMRIPNLLSYGLLLAAPIWWASGFLGSDIPASAGAGVARDAMGLILPNQGTGSLLPVFDLPPVQHIGLDILIMVIVFIPLYLSFQFNLGFGGGDVKLMGAASLFLGWPLALDFFILTFLIGGIFSTAIIVARTYARVAVKRGSTKDRLVKLAKFREFPFAPAIAIAAVICFSIKIEGIL